MAENSVPASAAAQIANAAQPSMAPDIPVVPIFQGSVSQWLAAKTYFASALLVLIALAGLVYGSVHHQTPVGTVCMIGGLALLLASLVMSVYVMAWVRSTRYTITNRLIEFETGLAMKKVNALDLGHVKHVEFVQGVAQRMLGIGSIEVYSNDQEEPKLIIEDIPNARGVYEKLRDAVIDLSRRRGIILE